MPPKKPIKPLSRKEEKPLLKAGLKLFSSGFPNPDRIGCPEPMTIQTLALRSLQLTLPERERWFDHMTICSPCFNLYRGLVRKKQFRGRATKVVLCAAVLLGGGLATWWGISRFHSQQGARPESPQAVQPVSPPEKGVSAPAKPVEVLAYTPMVLDLRNQAITRGSGSRHGKTTIPSVPRQRLELSIYLPVGSEEGEYQIRLLGENSAVLIETKGTARLENHRTVLRSQIDLTQLPAGIHRLGIRQEEWNWAYYPILVQ
jgi:hypothetical protein